MKQGSKGEIQQESFQRLVQGLGRSLAGCLNFWIDWIEVTIYYSTHVAARRTHLPPLPDRDLASTRDHSLDYLDQNRHACKIFRIWQRYLEGVNEWPPERRNVEPLRTDWEECFRKAEQYEQAVTTRLQTDAALLSLEESAKSIKEAESVGRLTQLAFIFVPLTFTTGVFGMNITPFGVNAPLWKFWITAILVSVGALALWSMFKRLENVVDSLGDLLPRLVKSLWRGIKNLFYQARVHRLMRELRQRHNAPAA